MTDEDLILTLTGPVARMSMHDISELMDIKTRKEYYDSVLMSDGPAAEVLKIGYGKQIKGVFSSINEAEAFIKDKFSPFSAVVEQNNQKYYSTGFGGDRKYYTIRNESSVYFPIIQLV